jgi:hypothetical protein
MNSKNASTTIPNLGPWQNRQAAMLYFYSSVAYLAPLHKMVSDIIDNVADPAIELAARQGRDKLLANKRWGARDTSRNWSNNAWPFLRDLQDSLAKDISDRLAGDYRKTSVSYYLRALAEYSTDWMTSQEEKNMNDTLARLSNYALPHDRTVDSSRNIWNDYLFFACFPEFAAKNPEIQTFRVRPDLSAATGELPPETGVYIAHDDPNATLQFVWREHGGAKLRPANTFNDIGLAALQAVGRTDLWRDASKMFDFAMDEKYALMFRQWIMDEDEPFIAAAPATVASSAFQSVPRIWSLVEIVPGQMEPIDAANLQGTVPEYTPRRIEGGEECTISGYYFTPSVVNSRRFFKSGHVFPKTNSQFGTTYWQWDADQSSTPAGI